MALNTNIKDKLNRCVTCNREHHVIRDALHLDLMYCRECDRTITHDEVTAMRSTPSWQNDVVEFFRHRCIPSCASIAETPEEKARNEKADRERRMAEARAERERVTKQKEEEEERQRKESSDSPFDWM